MTATAQTAGILGTLDTILNPAPAKAPSGLSALNPVAFVLGVAGLVLVVSSVWGSTPKPLQDVAELTPAGKVASTVAGGGNVVNTVKGLKK